jgi:hypothetical protein
MDDFIRWHFNGTMSKWMFMVIIGVTIISTIFLINYFLTHVVFCLIDLNDDNNNNFNSEFNNTHASQQPQIILPLR